jgi:YggT family protein
MVGIINATVLVLTLAIIGRALMSWIPNLDPRHPIAEFLVTVTDPMLAPIRAVVPRLGMFDLAPMLAILLLNLLVRPVLVGLVGGA